MDGDRILTLLFECWNLQSEHSIKDVIVSLG